MVASAPVDCDPLMGLPPDQAPVAVHAVALVDDQLKVALAPLFTVLGLALKVTLGADAATETLADCEALPLAPLHARV